MKQWDTVAIVGVGLMGGSIGLALRQRELARHVIGIGRRPESLRLAEQLGTVTAATLELAQGVRDAELVIVCTPVDQIVEHVQAASAACPAGTLITDVGSTKVKIVQQLDGRLRGQGHFIGSHPLAGSEKSGVDKASAELFADRVVVVTPTSATRDDDRERLVGFWESLGAQVLAMSPEAHDRSVAASSHLPHLIAAALSAATLREDWPLAAGGWRDTTRIAAGDPRLWAQIFSSNRRNVLDALVRFDGVLAALRTALERDNAAELEHLLLEAKQTRDAVGS